jgi:Pyruvate/2-oxoacid:ferredoxin oxidoreductase gamma subunit
LDGLKQGGILLVNTSHMGVKKIRQILDASEDRVKIFTVPADGIATGAGLKHMNMPMLGALHKVYDKVAFETALSYYEQNVPRPRDASLEAIRQGYTQTGAQEVQRAKKTTGPAVTQDFLDWRPEDHSNESWPSALEEVQLG